MIQLGLLEWQPTPTDRFGSTYDHTFDFDRLNTQQSQVFNLMKDGKYRTLAEISEVTGAPEASVSARLRDLRNMFHLKVDRRHRGDNKRGLYEYAVRLP